MIKKIQLHFGPKGRAEKFEIDPGSVTIFVGPNNSGKSMILREIEAYCQNGNKGGLKILDDIQFTCPADAELLRQLEDMKIPFQAGEQQFLANRNLMTECLSPMARQHNVHLMN